MGIQSHPEHSHKQIDGTLVERAHPTCVITLRNTPKLVGNLSGPGSVVLPWPPQVNHNEMADVPCDSW